MHALPSPLTTTDATDQPELCSAHDSKWPSLTVRSQWEILFICHPCNVMFDESIPGLPEEDRQATCSAVTALGILFLVMFAARA